MLHRWILFTHQRLVLLNHPASSLLLLNMAAAHISHVEGSTNQVIILSLGGLSEGPVHAAWKPLEKASAVYKAGSDRPEADLFTKLCSLRRRKLLH